METANVRPATRSEFENTIGYQFTSGELLIRALTHRSWAHERDISEPETTRHRHSETLEFVGDSVLGCVVAERLFELYPEANEGELSRMKHQIVSSASLALAAERIELGEQLQIGRGEEKTGGRQKQALLADGFEAVIAAIFLDGGYDRARDFIRRCMAHEFSSITPDRAAAADFKTQLQEFLQAQGLGTPRYQLVDQEGPPHRRRFTVEVSWDDGSGRGLGDSKKAAEADAARAALDKLRQPETS